MNGTQERNGNILCAQIAMVIHGTTAAITCRNTKINIQTANVTITFTPEVEWKLCTFEQLHRVCEEKYKAYVNY